MKRSSRAVLALAVLLLALVFACSNDVPLPAESRATARPAETPRPAVDVSVVRCGSGSFDYEMFSSVTEAARSVDTVVSGTVEGWEPGREVQQDDELAKFAVLEIKVEAATGDHKVGESAFVEVSLGSTLFDESGAEIIPLEGTKCTRTTVAELQDAVPAGARVLVLAEAAEGGDSLLAPVPQGLLLEEADGGFGSGVADQADVEFGDWPDKFEKLLSELRDAKILD